MKFDPTQPVVAQTHGSAAVDQPTKYFLVMIACSATPMALALVLPDPYGNALLPFGAFMLTFVFFFGLALALHALSLVWQVIRPTGAEQITCPACKTPDLPYRRFDVVRVAPSIYRIRCTTCGERWVERR